MWEIFKQGLSSSPDAVIGVSLIVIYFCYILCTAFKRIKDGAHMHH